MTSENSKKGGKKRVVSILVPKASQNCCLVFHGPNISWKCFFCVGFSTLYLGLLLTHLNSNHHQEKDVHIQCRIAGCTRTFVKVNTFVKHVQTSHKPSLFSLNVDNSEGPTLSGNSVLLRCKQQYSAFFSKNFKNKFDKLTESIKCFNKYFIAYIVLLIYYASFISSFPFFLSSLH